MQDRGRSLPNAGDGGGDHQGIPWKGSRQTGVRVWPCLSWTWVKDHIISMDRVRDGWFDNPKEQREACSHSCLDITKIFIIKEQEFHKQEPYQDYFGVF